MYYSISYLRQQAFFPATNTTYFLILTLILFVLILGENPYLLEDLQLNPFDYARITDVEYKAVVVDEPDSRGKVVITEKLTFDIHAASKNNLFWELWRDLPEYYVDGVKTSYNVLSVKQILEDGTEVIYEESPKLYWYDSDYVSTHPKYGPGKWFHSEGPYDEDEAQILLPNEDMPRPGNYDTFTYGTSSNVFLSRSLLPLIQDIIPSPLN